MKPIKIKLLTNYLIFSLGFGFAFLLVHWLWSSRSDNPPSAAGSYSVYIWIVSIVSGVFYHWRYVGKTKMNNTTGLLIPLLFIFGSVVACFGNLD